ncbi:MAG TPA: hypothetical protein VK814_14720 [Acidobacteriaceae bacterium]|jgi:hypothetical protein|nr:hypothetical protein [Acidobacteriaceae bacterium]
MRPPRFLLAALLLCPLLTSCGKDSAIPNVPLISTGNWYFYGNYTPSPGSPFNTGTLAFGGSLIQTNTQVAGVLHINHPCFGNNTTDIPYTGTLINNHLSFTSSQVAGQTLTLDGTLSQDDTVLSTAAFQINGGCAVYLYSPELTFTVNSFLNQKGERVPSLTGSWTTYLNTAGPSLTEHLTQSTIADQHGDFTLTGTVTIAGSPCFSTGTLQPTSLISGDLGQQVILLNDGSTLTATLNAGTVLSLYPGTVSGGNCNGPVDIYLQRLAP